MATFTVTTLNDEAFDGGDLAAETADGGGLSLREAIALANTSAGADDIEFDASLSGGVLRLTNGEIDVAEEVSIDGAANGVSGLVLTGDADDDDTTTGDVTDLSATAATELDDNSRVFNATADLSINDIALTGGRTTGDNASFGAGTYNGGAIKSTADVTLTNVVLSGNSTAGYNAQGGAVYTTGDIFVYDSTISGNKTEGDRARAGALYAEFGSFADLGTLTIENSVFENNWTEGVFSGGGAFAGGGASVANSLFDNNRTTGDDSDGGAFRIVDETIVTGSTFTNNYTLGEDARGGAVASDIDATNSTFVGNSTAGVGAYGGAISGFYTTLTNSTVTGNSTNASFAYGGGVFGSYVTAENSVIVGNVANALSDDQNDIGDDGFSAFTGNGRNIIGTDSTVFDTTFRPGVVNGDPTDIFASTSLVFGVAGGDVADNGGMTVGAPGETRIIQTVALLDDAGNPALDAGDDGIAPVLDQRGEGRSDIPGVANNGGAVSDLGAFELQASGGDPDMPSLTVTTALDVSNSNDGLISLREAVGFLNAGTLSGPIVFDAAVFGGASPVTIRLTQGEINIISAVTIDGDVGGDGTINVLITGDAAGDDTVVNGVTDLDATSSSELDDNTRLFNAAADLTLSGLILTGGRTTGDAGAADRTFSGGAIKSTADVDLTNVVLSGNSTAGDNAWGGAVYTSGVFTAEDSTVSGNQTEGGGARGGAIAASVGSAGNNVVFVDSVVSDNETQSINAGGGAVFGYQVGITNSLFSGNATGGSGARGGAVYAGYVTADRATFSGNSTSGLNSDGGAVEAFREIDATNSTFAGNAVNGPDADGGAIASGDVYLTNSTVTNNAATDSGGGVYGSFDVELTNTIVSGNFAATGGDDTDGMATVTLSGGNLIGDTIYIGAAAQPGSIDNTDVFDAIIDNNGQTAGVISDNFGPLVGAEGATSILQTVALNRAVSNPVLDAGDDGLAPATDQLGAPRADQPGVANNGANISDLGAIEVLPVEGVSTVVTTSADVDNDTDGLISIREAIDFVNSGLATGPITFDAGVFNGEPGDTIRLNSVLTIIESVTIDASGTGGVMITGDVDDNDVTDADGFTDLSANLNANLSDNVQIFRVTNSDAGLVLDGLELTGGRTATYGSGGGAVSTVGDVTIIDSQLSGNFNDAFYTAGGGAVFAVGDATITGSEISGNRGISYSFGGVGGGGVASLGVLTVEDSLVQYNSISAPDGAPGGGGLRGSTVIVRDSQILDNRSVDGSGGGISGGTVIIEDSTVMGNSTFQSAYAFYGGSGGGVVGTDVTITNSSILNNSTTGNYAGGGGVSARTSLVLDSSVVSGNSTAGDNMEGRSGGGGVSIGYDGAGVILNSLISGNSTEGYYSSGGGVFVSEAAALTLVNSTVAGNSTSGFFASGGGVYFDISEPSIAESSSFINATIANNSTDGYRAYGGGVSVGANVELTVTNSTVTGNYTFDSRGTGGGIAVGGYTTLNLANTLVVGNVSVDPALAGDDELGRFGFTYTINLDGQNLFGETASGYSADPNGGYALAADVFAVAANNNGVDAGVLADNGGPTVGAPGAGQVLQTVALLDDPTNLALDGGVSAAPLVFDEGAIGFDLDGDGTPDDVLALVSDIAFDQRGPGFDRTDGASVDIGAFELQGGMVDPEPGSLIVTIADDIVDPFDNETSLREAIAFAGSHFGADTVMFDASLAGETIFIGGDGEILIDSEVKIDGDIDGDGDRDITISADTAMGADDATGRIFSIADGDTANLLTVELEGLILRDGDGDSIGGAVQLEGGEELFLTNVEFIDNAATSSGGAIGVDENSGSLTNIIITDSDFTNNSAGDATGFGGVLFIANNLDADIDIRDSNFVGNSAGNDGGVISADDGIVLYTAGSYFSGNTASSSEGGVAAFDDDAQITIVGSLFNQNSAGYDGGAFYVSDGANFYIASSTFSNNQASTGVGNFADGGAIYAGDNAVFTISQSLFMNNSTVSDGGAIYANDAASFSIADSTFSLNETTGPSGDGGAIMISGGLNPGFLRATRTVFDENTSGGDGGAVFAGLGTIAVFGDTILSNNSADGSGGAVSLVGGFGNPSDGLFARSVLSSNSAGENGGAVFASYVRNVSAFDSIIYDNGAVVSGGAIFNESAYTTSLVNSTLTANSAGASGGASYAGSGVTFQTVNSIIAGNSATTGDDFAGDGATSGFASYGANILGSAPTGVSGGISLDDIEINGGLASELDDIFNSIGPGATTGITGGLLESAGGPLVGALGFQSEILSLPLLPNASNPAIDATDPTGLFFVNEFFPGIDLDGNGLVEDVLIFDDNFAFDHRGESRFVDVVMGGSIQDIGAFEVQMLAVGSPPEITSPAEVSVNENTNFVIDLETSDDEDSEGDGLTYSIENVAGGADGFFFTIDSVTGELNFIAGGADFENPSDLDGDNVYDVVVLVTDSDGLTDTLEMAITVEDVQEGSPPEITSPAEVSVDENTNFVIDLETSDDEDSEGDGLTYSIENVAGGADGGFFNIDSVTGELSFISDGPDFENPADLNGDNVYDVVVMVTDSDGLTDTLEMAITVEDVAEGTAPVALDFDVGVLGLEVDLTAFAEDIVAELATDADSALTASDINFVSATVDGAASSLAAIGFSYAPGSGVEGGFTINTEGASAFAGLTPGNSVDVVVTYTVTDGTETDTGELIFTVLGTMVSVDVEVDYLGVAITDEEITADVTSSDGAGADPQAQVVVTGDATLEEILGAADFTTPLISSSGELTGVLLSQELVDFIEDNSLTVAGALANDGAEASATAEDQGFATALALGMGSEAVSDAGDDSTAQSVASGNSIASADADIGSEASASAFDTSAAAATASDQSDAIALAQDGSASTATATTNSSATATSDGTSVATAIADETGTAVATSENGSSTTAFAADDSNANADAAMGSVANAIAIDGTVSGASASDASDALAFGAIGSAASAGAIGMSSASTASVDQAVGNTSAANQSTAVAVASDETQTTAFADMNSVALSVGESASLADTRAVDGSGANAFSDAGGTSLADADEASAAEAQATNDGSATATAITDALAFATADAGTATAAAGEIEDGVADDLTAEITANVTVAKAAVADVAMEAITADPVAVDALTAVVDQFTPDFDAELPDASAVAAAAAGGEANAVATQNSTANATATGDGTPGSAIAAASADDASEADAEAIGVADARSIALTNSSATSTAADSSANSVASDGSTTTATAEVNSIAAATANNDGTANAFAAEEGIADASASEGSNADAIAANDSGATATALNDADALAFAEDVSTATADAEDDSSASASADTGSTATSTADVGSTTIANATTGSAATATGSSSSSAISDAADGGEANAIALANSMADADATGDGTPGSAIASASADDDSDAEAEATGAGDARSIAVTNSTATSTSTDSSTRSVASDGSTATSTAQTNSVAVATADDDGAATAFAGEGSTSNADANGTSVANAVALNDSGATAAADNISDALAFAEDMSVADATAGDMSSASSSAETGSTASATALDDSTSTAEAADDANALAFAELNSNANAEAVSFVGTSGEPTEIPPSALADDMAGPIQTLVYDGFPMGTMFSAGTPSMDGISVTFMGPAPEDFTFTAPADFAGQFTLTITATDGDDEATATQVVTLTDGGGGGVLNIVEVDETVTVEDVTDVAAARTVAQVLRLPDGCGEIRLILNTDGTTSIEAILDGGDPLSAQAEDALGALDPGMLPAGATEPDLPGMIDFGAIADGDVVASNAQRIATGETSSVETDTSVSTLPGTVFVGDVDDPFNIEVITGQVDVIITTTTTITQSFTDLTVDDLVEVEDVSVEQALALLGDAPALADITDALEAKLETEPPTVSIADAMTLEGDNGDTILEFLVTKSEPSEGGSFVDVAVFSETATEGEDFELLTPQISFDDTQTEAVVQVRVFGDTDVEPDETFRVEITQALNAAGPLTILDGEAQGLIKNDDIDPVDKDIRFFLVDPETEQDVRELFAGDTIDPAELSTEEYTIRAEFVGDMRVESASFEIDGHFIRTENFVPYALFGDREGQFRGVDLPDEPFDVTVTFFSEDRGRGMEVFSETIDLSVGGGGGGGGTQNRDPIARDDSFTTPENTAVMGDVLANDEDPDGDPLMVELVDGPEDGDLNLDPDGGFTYTPDLDFDGVDTFSYRVLDGQGGVDEAHVTITVAPDPQEDDVRFFLVDPVTDRDVREVFNGDLIDLDELVSRQYSVRAEYVGDERVESVRFSVQGGGGRVENFVPYALFGDWEGDYVGGALPFDGIDLTASFYSRDEARGDLVISESLSLGVLEDTGGGGGGGGNEGDLRFFLVDTHTDSDIVELEDGDTLPGVVGRSIRVEYVGDERVESTVFEINGAFARKEIAEPYALFGDDAMGDFFFGALPEDAFELTARVFDNDDAAGSPVLEETITLNPDVFIMPEAAFDFTALSQQSGDVEEVVAMDLSNDMMDMQRAPLSVTEPSLVFDPEPAFDFDRIDELSTFDLI